MSHLNTGTSVIRDIACLEAAVKTFAGCTMQPAKSFRAYLGGECEHAITVPKSYYQLGVVKQKDGTYRLAYDADESRIPQTFGDKLCKLQQQYNRQRVLKSARAKGFTVNEQKQPDGSIRLQLLSA